MEILLILAALAVGIWFILSRKQDNHSTTAPYKLETPVVNTTSEPAVASVPDAVNPQITDAVTQVTPEPVVETAPVVEAVPVKKPRKPRTPKVKVEEAPKKVAVKKAAPPKKTAAMKAPTKVTKSKKS
jgi:outer membrane biosynthesis protein TonB